MKVNEVQKCGQVLPVGTLVYVRDAGVHAVSLGAAGLCLLQLWTGCPTAYWELAEPSGARALSLGPVGVVAVLGAGGPFGPLAHHAVFGHDAGLEGERRGLLRAHAAGHEQIIRPCMDRSHTSPETCQRFLPERLHIPVLVNAGHFPGLVAHLDIPEFPSGPVLAVPVSLLLDELFGLGVFHFAPLFELFLSPPSQFFSLFFLFGFFRSLRPVRLSGRPVWSLVGAAQFAVASGWFCAACLRPLTCFCLTLLGVFGRLLGTGARWFLTAFGRVLILLPTVLASRFRGNAGTFCAWVISMPGLPGRWDGAGPPGPHPEAVQPLTPLTLLQLAGLKFGQVWTSCTSKKGGS